MQLKDISVTTKFTLTQGGRYLAGFHATGWGTAILQRLAADGMTYLTLPLPDQWTNPAGTTTAPRTTVNADEAFFLDLPAGSYQILLSGVTALYFELARISHSG